MGGLIYYFLRKYEYKQPMLSTLVLLVFFECLELFLMYVPKLIYPESIVDTTWDLLIGMAAAFLIWLGQRFE